MKRVILLLFITIVPLFNISNFSSNVYADKLTADKVINDVGTIRCKVDSTTILGKELIGIFSDEVKTYGLKQTIQMNGWLFGPLFIIIVLFLLFLKGKQK